MQNRPAESAARRCPHLKSLSREAICGQDDACRAGEQGRLQAQAGQEQAKSELVIGEWRLAFSRMSDSVTDAMVPG